MRIDLGEIGGFERHGDAELRQAVGQLGRVLRVEQMHGVRPLGLQPPLHTVLGRKIAQPGFIGLAQGLQVAQHQGGDGIAARQFDLRAGITRIHAGDQATQRHEQGINVRGQHFAGLHVGDVAAFSLVKADEHFALFDHMAHRQPGAVAVAPSGAFDGAQDGVGLDLAQVPQVVLQHTLFAGDLGTHIQVLHLAAAASAGVQAKVGAAWAHAQR